MTILLGILHSLSYYNGLGKKDIWATIEREKNMNEKEPNGNLPQAPILSPETLAPKRPESSALTDSVSPSKELEQDVLKKNRGTKILVGSLAALLLTGSVTLAILAKSGAFSKEKKTGNETTASAVSETTATTAGAEDTNTTDPSSAKKGPHISIDSLSQITDEQFKIMDEAAREYIRKDGISDEDVIPKEVDIDGMYYLGMIRSSVDYASSSAEERDMVQLVYQVQVTDNTGDEPVKRQYLWMHGFQSVYQDGTIDPTKIDPMWGTICFDNWSAQGCLDYTSLLHEAELRYTVRENGVDFTLWQPFDGDYSGRHSLVTSLDQITPAMEEGFKKGGEFWMNYARVGAGVQVNGATINKVEYAGLALASVDNENRVFVIYRLDITDLNQTPPVDRSIYWYLCFEGTYEGGQIQTRCVTSLVRYSMDLAEWMDGPDTIEGIRAFIKKEEAFGWDYQDNLDETAAKKATSETSAPDSSDVTDPSGESTTSATDASETTAAGIM